MKITRKLEWLKQPNEVPHHDFNKSSRIKFLGTANKIEKHVVEKCRPEHYCSCTIHRKYLRDFMLTMNRHKIYVKINHYNAISDLFLVTLYIKIKLI